MDTSDSTTIPPTKRCSLCETRFPATHEYFVHDKTKPDGFYSRCRTCGNKRREREALPEGFKRCTKCKLVKSVDRFTFNKRRGKHDSWCKECHCERVKAQYVPSPREIIPPEEKKRRKAKLDADYRVKNRAKLTDYFEQYYAAHSNEIKQRVKDWTIANKDKVRANNKRRKALRRARELQAEGSFTAQDILIAYRSQKGKCWHCGKHVGDNYHDDHLIPLKRGGSNNPNNIVISCAPCNLSKGAKLTQEWNGKLF